MSSKDRNVGLGLPLSNFVILDVSDVINVSSTIFYFRTTYAVHCSIFRMKSLHDWNGAGSVFGRSRGAGGSGRYGFERVLDQLGVSKNCREL